jgi:hypothetical protein
MSRSPLTLGSGTGRELGARLATVVVGMAIIGGLAACSSNGANGASSGSPSSPQSKQQEMLAYVQCMRSHGVQMPDPDSNGMLRMQATQQQPGPESPDEKKMDAANSACKHFVPEMNESPEQQHVNEIKIAECMRQHGVQMSDPGPNQSLALPGNPNDPKIKTAMNACEKLIAP